LKVRKFIWSNSCSFFSSSFSSILLIGLNNNQGKPHHKQYTRFYDKQFIDYLYLYFLFFHSSFVNLNSHYSNQPMNSMIFKSFEYFTFNFYLFYLLVKSTFNLAIYFISSQTSRLDSVDIDYTNYLLTVFDFLKFRLNSQNFINWS
jgi:hypothetical protein